VSERDGRRHEGSEISVWLNGESGLGRGSATGRRRGPDVWCGGDPCGEGKGEGGGRRANGRELWE